MSNRDSDASVEIPAPPEAHEAPSGVDPRGAARPPRMVQRISVEEMASWIRLEHISCETAERLITAAKQDFARPSRAERDARNASQEPGAPLDGEDEMPAAVAPPKGRARSGRQASKKKK